MPALRGQRSLTPLLMSTLEYVCRLHPGRVFTDLDTALLLDDSDRPWCRGLVLPSLVHGYLWLRGRRHVDHLALPPWHWAAQTVHHTVLGHNAWYYRCRNGFIPLHFPCRQTGCNQLQRVDGLPRMVSCLVL